jgi:hypothetical protein
MVNPTSVLGGIESPRGFAEVYVRPFFIVRDKFSRFHNGVLVLIIC